MEYYKLLQLDREPFSNSPDPEYFFNSRQHMGCLQKLELALRLKRGLNVVIGDVGTGKTTLCRQLIRKFSSDPDVETHLILDPSFDASIEFLKSILAMICAPADRDGLTQTEMKETIKQTLFRMGVDEDKTIVLIIDEGQKISDPCLEILRELLNYETNTFKLLQIVIFAQLEFNAILQTHANFADRINLLHHLEPLSFTDTRQLIQHRIKLSSTTAKPIVLFSLPALWAIYRASHGYPRKIIHLCHQSVLALIIQNQTKAGWALIQSCKKRLGASRPSRRNMVAVTTLCLVAALLIIVYAPAFKSKYGAPSQVPAYKIENTPPALPAAIVQAPRSTASQTAEKPGPENDPGLSTALPVPVEATPQSGDPSPENADATTAAVTRVPDTTPNPQLSPPQLLGTLIVRPGDTISAMTQQVYGTHHNRFLRSVIEANPYIKDPNDIKIGNIIEFPSLPLHPSAPQKTVYMVVLDERRTLAAAIQRLQKISALLISKPKLVATWAPTQGLRFQLIQRQYFPNAETARIHLEQLPYVVAARAAIFSGWPAETVFYSDPFEHHAQPSF